ncbi:hypothetical protein Ldro_2698 [Legionella drozanskii LLAP-1]|uniref:Uncharacterized protein n=1 Tax=Legionella drozanskii LLAP-1 TaxID=1212489 RepID=A0A0W0SMD3_9GAMM|nr:hypothetical protein Ldro_2698 [Legionella drozanskii LLAP-1]
MAALGKFSSNHEKAQTLSVMSLHLLQLSMAYIKTLMIQQIIEELGLKDQLTKKIKDDIYSSDPFL